MNDGSMMNIKILCGLMMFILFFILPAHAMTDEDIELCINKYQEQFSPYEKAKEMCSGSVGSVSMVTTSGSGFIEPSTGNSLSPDMEAELAQETCIREYMDKYGTSFDDAKLKCEFVAPVVETEQTVEQETDYCKDLEKKLSSLKEDLEVAEKEGNKQEYESVKNDIETLKKDLAACGNQAGVAVTFEEGVAIPLIYKETEISPCDQVKIDQQKLDEMAERISDLEEMAEKDEKYKLKLYHYQMDFADLKEHLEKAKTACEQGTPIEKAQPPERDTPCFLLSGYESIYEKEKARMDSINDGELKLQLQADLEKMRETLDDLKEKCRAQELKSENVVSLMDVEKAYMAKQKLIVEETSEDELAAKLQSIEKEKKELIEEFASKMAELDLRQTSIIKKMEIKGGKAYLDDIKTESSKFKLEVGDNELEIELNDEGLSILDGDILVDGEIGLEYEDGALVSSNSKKKINIMPSEINGKKELAKKKFVKVRIVDDGKPLYIAKSIEKGKILGILPVDMEIDYEISAENGELLGMDDPWYGSLVSYS